MATTALTTMTTTIATASTAIVTPISPSSTRQAVGRANQGASQRAPTPSRLNQTTLAVLAPGDRLVIASDGLYECMSPAGEPFAESRLEPLLLGQRSASLPALLTTLLQQLTVWHQKLGPDDDVSVLVVEVRGGEHDEV